MLEDDFADFYGGQNMTPVRNDIIHASNNINHLFTYKLLKGD